ncbi:hypothetical protein SprV_0602172100 [Sparganum proliferum]
MDFQERYDKENPRRFEELAAARQILTALTSPSNAHISFPFMDRIDAATLGLQDYDEVIRYPMWLNKISEKLDRGIYPGIREFVCDFRLILVNCFRYNGVTSRMGRFAEKLELLFEQKLQLLSPDIRAKTTLQSSLGCGSSEQEVADSGLVRRRNSSRLFSTADSRQTTPIRALMEELEHAPNPDGGGMASCLYEGVTNGIGAHNPAFLLHLPDGPTLSMNNETSRNLLVARLTLWQRKRREEELSAGWNAWWAQSSGPEILSSTLRKSPEFLEIFQMLWLLDPFLGLSDALTTATQLQEASSLSGEFNTFALPMSPFTTTTSSRNISLLELELGLSAAPQASLALAACMAGLLHTSKERASVAAALNALGNESVTALSKLPPSSAGGDTDAKFEEDEDGIESGGGTASRRIQSSHLDVLHSLSVPPYDIWERRLAARVAQWYQVPLKKRLEAGNKLERRYGVSLGFFKVCGHRKNPLEDNRFHELPMHQQLHIILALLSSLFHSENFRASLDSSADWGRTRPAVLGEDAFRGLTFFHFPEMLGSELSTSIRIFQYRYPPFNADEFILSLPPIESSSVKPEQLDLHPLLCPPANVEVIYLPGPAFRCPYWMEPAIGRFVRNHLVNQLEREIDRLKEKQQALTTAGSSAGSLATLKLNKKTTNHISTKRQKLLALLEPFRAHPRPGRKAGAHVGRASEKREANLAKKDVLAFQLSRLNEPALHLSDFAYFHRVSCGPVPISIHGRPGGKHLRQVDSSASLAESSKVETDEDSQAATPPPTDAASDCDDAPSFVAGGGSADDKRDTVPQRTVVPSEAYNAAGEPEDMPPTSPLVLCRNTSTDTWCIGKGKERPDQPSDNPSPTKIPADVHISKQNSGSLKHNPDAAVLCNGQTEFRAEELNETSAVNRAASVKTEGRGQYEADADPEVISKDEDTGESSGATTPAMAAMSPRCEPSPVTAAEAKKEEPAGKETPQEAEKEEEEGDEELQTADQTANGFENIVFDLATFSEFVMQLSARLSTGTKLLKNLQLAHTNNNEQDLRAAVEDFKLQLGAGLVDKIAADDTLAPLLGLNSQQRTSTVEGPDEKVENELTPMASASIPRSRRGAKRKARHRLWSRQKRLKGQGPEEIEPPSNNEEADEDAPSARILRLHEEALEGLQQLHDEAVKLKAFASTNENDRFDAERLTCLRLRKDVEAWEEARKPKKKKPQPKRVALTEAQPLEKITTTVPTRYENTAPSVPPARPSSLQPLRPRALSPPPAYPAAPLTSAVSGKLPLPPYRPITTALARPLPAQFVRTPPPAVPSLSPLLPKSVTVSTHPTPRPPMAVTAAVPRPPPPVIGSHQHPNPRRIFRFYDTLFTEDARPVRVDPSGALIFLPDDSVPLGHRQMAKQMIERYRSSSTLPSSSPSAASHA